MQRKSDEKILNQYKEFCNREYNDAVRAIKNKWFKPKEVINGAIDRCLGVAQFVQLIGVNYEDSDIVYSETEAKLEELRGLRVDK